jgi:lipid-binding SYLF domain-containing protein
MNRLTPARLGVAAICFLVIGVVSPFRSALADDYDYSAAIAVFKHAGASAGFFKSSYGYAVFPTIGKGGFVVGGAYGKGRVYKKGRFVGDTTVAQVSVGFQAGAQAYSEIIFFQTPLDLARFESGKFALGAQASAVAVTAGASASASTAGTSAGMSGTERNATTVGRYQDGIAVFTVAKGGLMYEATVAGQKFTYEPRR